MIERINSIINIFDVGDFKFFFLVAKKNLRIYEVGIKYYGRKYSEGKKITWVDGFRAIYCIIYYSIFK